MAVPERESPVSALVRVPGWKVSLRTPMVMEPGWPDPFYVDTKHCFQCSVCFMGRIPWSGQVHRQRLSGRRKASPRVQSMPRQGWFSLSRCGSPQGHGTHCHQLIPLGRREVFSPRDESRWWATRSRSVPLDEECHIVRHLLHQAANSTGVAARVKRVASREIDADHNHTYTLEVRPEDLRAGRNCGAHKWLSAI